MKKYQDSLVTIEVQKSGTPVNGTQLFTAQITINETGASVKETFSMTAGAFDLNKGPFTESEKEIIRNLMK